MDNEILDYYYSVVWQVSGMIQIFFTTLKGKSKGWTYFVLETEKSPKG